MRLEDVLQSILAMQEMGEYLDVRLESFQNAVISSINEKITKAFTYRKMGVGIFRFSVGIEDSNDIIEDLNQALAKVP